MYLNSYIQTSDMNEYKMQTSNALRLIWKKQTISRHLDDNAGWAIDLRMSHFSTSSLCFWTERKKEMKKTKKKNNNAGGYLFYIN